MACYYPIPAWRARAGLTTKGNIPLVFKAEFGIPGTELSVPCGQCIGCRLERSRQWAIRCYHESKLHDYNCFLTLTYSPENENRVAVTNKDTGEVFLSLNKRDYVLFLKSLRKEFGPGIRFFQCGEYGEVCKMCGQSEVYCKCKQFVPTLGRPHHHMILFGFDFSFDRYVWSHNNGFPLYRSPSLERLWPHGYSSIAECTFDSAAYVARYILKKVNGDKAPERYDIRLPEYITMSRRPGIARDYAEKNLSDWYPSDKCAVRPGLIARPPKFYDKIYDLLYPDKFLEIKENRRRNLEKFAEDNTPERLAVRERVQRLRAEKLIRPIENGKGVYE